MRAPVGIGAQRSPRADTAVLQAVVGYRTSTHPAETGRRLREHRSGVRDHLVNHVEVPIGLRPPLRCATAAALRIELEVAKCVADSSHGAL